MKKVLKVYILVLSLVGAFAPSESFGEFCSTCGVSPGFVQSTSVNVGVSVVRTPIIQPIPQGMHGMYGGGFGGGYGYGGGYGGGNRYAGCSMHRGCRHAHCGRCSHRCCGRRKHRSFALNIGFGFGGGGGGCGGGGCGGGGGFGFSLGFRSSSF